MVPLSSRTADHGSTTPRSTPSSGTYASAIWPNSRNGAETGLPGSPLPIAAAVAATATDVETITANPIGGTDTIIANDTTGTDLTGLESPRIGVYATAAWRLRGSLAEREGNPARAVELDLGVSANEKLGGFSLRT
mgnify:CR=1 FL=1